MISVETHGDVTRLRMASLACRATGMDVSAYLVRGTLIDSGFPLAAAELASALNTLRVTGAVLTHWHEDHAGNAMLLAKRGLPMLAAAATLDKLRQRPSILPYRHVFWGRPPAFAASPEPYVDDTLRFVPTPGHTPDHHVVFDETTRTVFSGDLWLGVRNRAIHPNEDLQATERSLRVVIALEPARMFDAHRGLVTDPVRALAAKAEWLAETTGVIRQRLTEGWREGAILREVLGGEDRVAWISFGEYSRRNFVRAVARSLSN